MQVRIAGAEVVYGYSDPEIMELCKDLHRTNRLCHQFVGSELEVLSSR
jgi:hypothetical protein